MRGQASFELLVSVGLLFGMLAIGLASSANSFSQLRYSGDVLTAERTVADFSSAIDDVYYQGAPASKTLTLEIPQGAETTFDCAQKFIEIKITTDNGQTLSFENIRAPCEFNGTLTSGTYLLEAGNIVSIKKLG